MTRKPNRPRRLVVDADTVYLWKVGHQHTPVAGRFRDCRTTLSLRHEGTTPRLVIAFREAAGRFIADGYYWPPGSVGDTAQNELNLYEPGAARRLIDVATARGLLPAPPGTTEVDGWPLFDAVVAGADRQPVSVQSQGSRGRWDS
ncbi:hypothetical protein [Streptomyces sp. NPDC019890]|uniref:hypothetical protein n=1 Tax=Streptomyces sp. NPDC019890 TaxID=3365064 RepID=UPI0038502EF1